MKYRISRWLVLPALLLSGSSLMPQESKADGSISILFHVTSVKQDEPSDYCTTGACIAVRYTVEGYSRVKNDTNYTQFVLKCVEMTVLNPAPHDTVSCARVRANGSYRAKLFADILFFIDERSKNPESGVAAYDIVSQREVVKH